jgi:hypothetical protein
MHCFFPLRRSAALLSTSFHVSGKIQIDHLRVVRASFSTKDLISSNILSTLLIGVTLSLFKGKLFLDRD